MPLLDHESDNICMKAFRKSTAAAAALAAAFLGILVTPGQAQAEYPSARVVVCNFANNRVLTSVTVEGLNQNNSYYKTPNLSADVENCGYRWTDYWWKGGQNLKVTLNFRTGSPVTPHCWIPSDVQDGRLLPCAYAT
ncbi:hypothetical protein [Streptomyces sp. NBC_01314]|uniref:hypothetical protein n=1 Tax=Streptomyces sp. NBC_01314 TaxID=2903821 RepID=UPI003092ADA4|nr:hypothetical protein OG622_48795 [Streptomyces sp. NBC_01314]